MNVFMAILVLVVLLNVLIFMLGYSMGRTSMRGELMPLLEIQMEKLNKLKKKISKRLEHDDDDFQ